MSDDAAPDGEGDGGTEEPADPYAHQTEIPFSRQAFKDFVDAHREEAVRAATGIVGSRASGEDVAQVAFTELARAWKRKGVMREPQALLYKTVMFRARDERAKNTPIPLTDEALISRITADRVMAMPDFSPGIDGLFTSMAVVAALKQLPVRQQQVLALRIGLRWELGAVSAVMACSADAVKSLQERGLRTLRASPLLTGHRTPLPEAHQ
ncbi:sigma-70 family RNA polymerase sigma factor (plasmid) [Amycolatopsis sp. FU40]|uniref:RNA polymerase sigma factor n=1 Tax=Amycolatopsis sp. FU40 TaxID=2914159 RepID=UPI001F4318C7|nr:sigma-70 family RNA polymerase sigma factor [Amycolatopsis sp. FU40]UKD50834.1 sigma-70 family RNA polymerase sigma factor [Amycolatopsis sp. FU40]